MIFPSAPATLLLGHLYAMHYPLGGRLGEHTPAGPGRLAALVAGHALLHEHVPEPDGKHAEAHLRAAAALDPAHEHHPDEIVRRARELAGRLAALRDTAAAAAAGDSAAAAALADAFTPDRAEALCAAAERALRSAPVDRPDRRSGDWLTALLDPR